ncbi:PDR/VanB family oxidoreductase [Halomonas salipaludis]|uniref:Oxidoreductase n=1 Tax=Halomonas salipaludis TaxID=2032625 RepID=A0A2A2EQT4_9GAMM|nr:PDR/VanB family oxidoreductase [Halomonas salipaludis]PAU74722.1 oxidoreductase [Halomonas salipaludis]
MHDALCLEIRHHQALGERLYRLDLAASDGATLPPAAPGAHLALTLPNGMMRHYSLLDGADDGIYRIAVLHERDSRGGSAWLAEHAMPGTRLTASGPHDRFPLDESAAHHCLVGAGIGITPLVAMARRLHALDASRELHYLVRHRRQALFAAALAPLFPPGKLHLHVSSEHGRTRLDTLVNTPRASTRVYACGPASLLDELECLAADWPAGCLRLERFHNDTVPSDAPQDACEVILEASGRRFTLAPGQSLIDALEVHGVAPPRLCCEGVCGTCATPLLDGEVEHLDAVQSSAEKALNDLIYPCVSRPRGPRLVLDL